ncbi:sigma-70 family RNA polymerase sigma factor [Streptomyces sp. NPDC052015]|uniref:RNA polymerase sigma factor n=1 Tax=Streptomyces sp. NPDC052015 TaxID=3154755 RepID=UPI0034304928
MNRPDTPMASVHYAPLLVGTENYAGEIGGISRIRHRALEPLAEVAFAPVPRDADRVDGDPVDQEYGDVDGIPFEWVKGMPVMNFDEFHAEHRTRLIALVRKILRECWYDVSIDPEDIVQDTMEMAVRNWPRIGRMMHPDRYLRRVAAKRALRAMEKSVREVSTSTEGFLTLFEGSLTSGIERSPEQMVAADLVRDVLKSLPHRQAQVLLLTADGWSDSEIGQSLGISPGTVRSHRRHVRKVFAERLPLGRWWGLVGVVD